MKVSHLPSGWRELSRHLQQRTRSRDQAIVQSPSTVAERCHVCMKLAKRVRSLRRSKQKAFDFRRGSLAPPPLALRDSARSREPDIGQCLRCLGRQDWRGPQGRIPANFLLMRAETEHRSAISRGFFVSLVLSMDVGFALPRLCSMDEPDARKT